MDNLLTNYDDLEVMTIRIEMGVLDIGWKSDLGHGHVQLLEMQSGNIEIDHDYVGKDFVKALLNKVVEKYFII